MKTVRRPIPTALVLTLTLSAGAVLSMPQAAEAATSTSVATAMAEEVLSLALGSAFDVAMDAIFGSGSDPVILSQESYVEIKNIVDDVVGSYFSTEHSITLQTAYDLADNYSCDPGIDDLEECEDDLDTNEDKAIEAANAMYAEGLAGGPSFGLATALEITTYFEHSKVCGLLGWTCEEGYQDSIVDTGALAVDHMTTLLDQWHVFEDNVVDHCDGQGPLLGIQYWTDIYGHTHYGHSNLFASPPVFVTCEEEYEEYMAGFEDLRDSILGESFDALLDEFNYYATSAWLSGQTSTELFCDSFDDATVMFKRGGGTETMVRMGSDYVVGLPDGTKDVYTIMCNSAQTKIRLQDYTGSYVRGRPNTDGYDYDIEPSDTKTSDSTAWTAWLRPDGEWVLRNFKQGRYLSLASFPGEPVTQDKEASELTIVVMN